MNPYLPEWFIAECRIKWGQPKNLGRDETGGFRYECLRCGAGWVGPNGDTCEWCHKRWTIKRDDVKRALLIPEWLEWGEPYFRLDVLGQAVWEETRGFKGDFVTPWTVRLDRAVDDGQISDNERALAFGRFDKWMTLKQSPRSESGKSD